MKAYLISALLAPPAAALHITPCTMSAKSTSNWGGSRRAWLGTASGAASAGLVLAPARPAWAKLVYFPERGVEASAARVRKMGPLLEDLQADLAAEEWDFIVEYPGEFRSFVPAFTKYTDAAFPDDTEIDKSLRVAMRYEVGKLFRSVEDLRKASQARDLKNSQAAFAMISLSFDRYLKSGNLYEGDASAVQGDAMSDVPKLKKVSGKAKPPAKQITTRATTEARGSAGRGARRGGQEPAPAAPRPVVSFTLDEPAVVGDAVVIYSEGYMQGMTGTLIGVDKESKVASGIVKTSEFVRGFREILVVPMTRIAKQSGGDVPVDPALAK